MQALFSVFQYFFIVDIFCPVRGGLRESTGTQFVENIKKEWGF